MLLLDNEVISPVGGQVDMTDQYNTDLGDNEKEYQDWVKSQGREKDTFDYDLRGWYAKNGPQELSDAHLTDEFKKPNHPTFSDQSKYSFLDESNPTGNVGGHWSELPENKYSFRPGPSNVQNLSSEELQAYFRTVESGNVLLPYSP